MVPKSFQPAAIWYAALLPDGTVKVAEDKGTPLKGMLYLKKVESFSKPLHFSD